MPARLTNSLTLCLVATAIALVLSVVTGAFGQITDNELRPIPAIPELGYLESFVDPVFGATVTRITGIPGEPIPGINGVWSAVSRHGYSKRSAWNCDQSLLLLGRHKGSPPMLFLDGKTYEPAFGRHSPGTEVRWHVSRPMHMIFVRDSAVGLWNVTTNAIDSLVVFHQYSDLHIGPWEGNLSADGHVIVLNAQRDSHHVAFAYDLRARTKYADLPLDDIDVDWVSASASGHFIVVNGAWHGQGDQTQVYNLDGRPVGALWSLYGRPSHYDLTLDAAGDDIAVGVSKSPPDEGRVIARRLRDGAVTVLTDGGYASHTSTRNVARPGWAYVTYQHPGPSWPPYWNEVVAVSLAGDGIERIAHLHAVRTQYDAESHALPSPDGRRVLFASNWATPADTSAADASANPMPVEGTSTSDRAIAAYVAELP